MRVTSLRRLLATLTNVWCVCLGSAAQAAAAAAAAQRAEPARQVVRRAVQPVMPVVPVARRAVRRVVMEVEAPRARRGGLARFSASSARFLLAGCYQSFQ